MAGLDAAALAALAQLANSTDADIEAEAAGNAAVGAEAAEEFLGAELDAASAGEEKQDLALAIACELLGREKIDAAVPLAQQGAGDLDIAALISRLERELGITISDNRFVPQVSIVTLLGDN